MRPGDLLASLSVAYPQADTRRRAELAAAIGPLEGAYARLTAADAQAFLLVTCLRVEITVPGDAEELRRIVSLLTGGAESPSYATVRSGAEAVRHLFRIAAGLESPLAGEREILTQFRQALTAARGAGAVAGGFGGLLDTALAVGRSARELLPDSPHRSMAAISAQLVGPHPRVGVVGTGTMGTAVVEALSSLPAPPEVVVFARDPSRTRLPVEVRPVDRLEEALPVLPAIVSATAATGRLVAPRRLEELLAPRDEPLVAVDMAMPPDLAPTPTTRIVYHDIDDLAALAARAGVGEHAARFVDDEARRVAAAWTHRDAVVPVIAGLYGSMDRAVEEVVARFSGRLSDPADATVLEQTVRTALRKVLHGPVRYLNDAPDPERARVLAEAFGVDDA